MVATYGVAGTYRQGSSAAPAFAAPASIVSTSIVVLDFYLDVGATINSLPSGFVHVTGSPLSVNPGGGGEHKICRIWARNPAGSTYTVNLSASVYSNGVASRADGCVATGDPWDPNSGTGTAVATAGDITSGTTPAVSMTRQNPDQLEWFTGSNWGGGAWTPPTGYTEQLDSGDQTLTVATRVQASSGASGSITATCATSDRRGALLGSLLTTAVGGGSDVNIADIPTGFRAQVAPDTVAVGLVVADSPRGMNLRAPAAETVSINPGASDSPNGLRSRSAEGAGVTSGVTIADVPRGTAWRSQAETVAAGVTTGDAPIGLAWVSTAETVTIGLGASDAPNGLRWGSGAETVSFGLTIADAPIGYRLGQPSALAGAATTVPDATPSGFRLSAPGGTAMFDVVAGDQPAGLRSRAGSDGVVLGVTITDLPFGWRSRAATETVASGVTVADSPGMLRIGSALETVAALGGIGDVARGFRWGSGESTVSGAGGITGDIDIYAAVWIVRADGSVPVNRLDGTVRRLRS